MGVHEEREMRTRRPSEADTREATVAPSAGCGRECRLDTAQEQQRRQQ